MYIGLTLVGVLQNSPPTTRPDLTRSAQLQRMIVAHWMDRIPRTELARLHCGHFTLFFFVLHFGCRCKNSCFPCVFYAGRYMIRGSYCTTVLFSFEAWKGYFQPNNLQHSIDLIQRDANLRQLCHQSIQYFSLLRSQGVQKYNASRQSQIDKGGIRSDNAKRGSPIFFDYFQVDSCNAAKEM